MYLGDGKRKGNVDAELVLQAMIEYPNYERAIIVTGDGDFGCLVRYLNRTSSNVSSVPTERSAPHS